MRSLRSLTQDERLFVHPEQVPRRGTRLAKPSLREKGQDKIIFETAFSNQKYLSWNGNKKAPDGECPRRDDSVKR